jgi:hypothetical protein
MMLFSRLLTTETANETKETLAELQNKARVIHIQLINGPEGPITVSNLFTHVKIGKSPLKKNQQYF